MESCLNNTLSDLVDLTQIQKLSEAHYKAAGMPIGIIDSNSGAILVGAGWQDVCTQFHRANPLSLNCCLESDMYIKGRIFDGKPCAYKCKNGLWDIGIPISVDGCHLATLFLGQFFYEGEIPDRDFFVRQAEKFGYDISAYLAALDRVPVFSRAKVDTILDYNMAFAGFISDLAQKKQLLNQELKERKRAEEALHEVAQRLQLATQSAKLGVWDWNIANNQMIWDDRMLELYGVTRQSFHGGIEAWQNGLHPEDKERTLEECQAALRGEREWDTVFRVLHPDGTVKYIKADGLVIRNSGGEAVRMLGINYDITERKRTEEMVRESETRFRSLFEHMLNGFAYCQMVFDEHGRPDDFVYLAVNDAFGRLTGLTDVIGKRVTQIIPRIKELNPELFEIYGRVASTGDPERFEIDFEPLGLYLSVSVYSPTKGCFVAVFDDITQSKQADVDRQLLTEILYVLNRGGNLHGVIRETLRLIQHATGFDAVGLRLRQGEDYPYFEHNGFSEEFLHKENLLCARGGDGAVLRDPKGRVVLECTCGLVLSGQTDPKMPCFTKGGSFWTNVSSELLALPRESDPRINPRNRCLQNGYQSVGLFPVRTGAEIVGLLQLNDLRKRRFTSERVAFCESVANNIGLALQREASEEALRESEQRLQLFIEHAPAAIAMFDHKMRYIAVSRRYLYDYRLTGDIIGRSHYEIFPKIPGRWKEAHRHGLAGETLRSEGDRFERADGTVQWVKWDLLPWRAATGGIGGIIIATEDITERKHAEEEILRLSEEMAARNVELETVNKELESFIYSVSHDLRAPVRHMTGFAEIILNKYRDRLGQQGQDYLMHIRRGADKMMHLIDDLLRLSRISRQAVARTAVDLSTLAHAVITSLKESDPNRKTTFSVAEGVTVFADEGLMEIVLSNLLGNAWKFTKKTEDARIEFGHCGLRNADCRIKSEIRNPKSEIFFVRDNGAGFNPEHKDSMFWPFHRLHPEKEFEGTGIGLAIVERIIHRHGGKIWAEGEVGKGATIYFTLT